MASLSHNAARDYADVISQPHAFDIRDSGYDARRVCLLVGAQAAALGADFSAVSLWRDAAECSAEKRISARASSFRESNPDPNQLRFSQRAYDGGHCLLWNVVRVCDVARARLSMALCGGFGCWLNDCAGRLQSDLSWRALPDRRAGRHG